jgi:regulator of cell morphogenesis and NO signaling
MPFSPDATVAAITGQFPGATRTLQRFAIEPCCDGALRLDEACRQRRVSFDAVSAALRSAFAASSSQRNDWLSRPPAELTAHIVEAFHEPLRQELPSLQRLAQRLQGHEGSDQRALALVLQELTRFVEGLGSYMEGEEGALFPLIDRISHGDRHQGDADRFAHLRVAAETAHEDQTQMLRLIGQATDEYTPSHAACSTLRGFYHELKELERLMRLHVHLEDHVLFSRVAVLLSGTVIERS